MGKQGLAENTILLGIGALLSKGLLFVMVPFFSRWLTAEDYGSFDLIITSVALMLPLLTLASGEAVFRFSIDTDSIHEKRKYISNGFGIVMINSIILLIIIMALFIFSGYEKILIPFLLLLYSQLINRVLRSYLRAIKKLKMYSVYSAITVLLISLFVTFFIRILNLGLNGMIYGYAIGYLVGDFIIICSTKYWTYIEIKNISIQRMKDLVKYSFPLIPNSISWWVLNVSDRFFINIIMGPAFNGVYAIANKIPAISSSLFSVFNISWQQTATEVNALNDVVKRNEYFNIIYNKMFSVLLSLCSGILSINFILFRYIFDSKYYEARLYSPILVTAIIFMLLSQFFGGIQISLKMPKENGITTVMGAISNILMNVIFIRRFGLFAASISTFLSYLLVAYVRKNRIKKEVTFNLSRYTTYYIYIYLYFFVSCYLNDLLIISIINIIIATGLFIYSNKTLINKLFKKLKNI